MILVGLEDCATCKIAHGLLPDVPYVVLKKSKTGEPSSQEVMDIKRVLGKMNSDGHFPIILNDEKTKIIHTDELLNNLNQTKLENVLVNQ